jgi:hypothetical protein
MHKRTQSIRQQSDQYVDESELPFTPPREGDDVLVAGPVSDRDQPSPQGGTEQQPRDGLGTAAR